MRSERRWLCWVFSRRSGKPTKVPVRIDGRAASSTNPDDWTTFDAAYEAAERRSLGIGFVLGGPFIGIDLDQVVADSGAIESWAADIIEAIDSYTELSPSGAGVHILCRSDKPLPGTRRRVGNFEIYPDGRFFTVTGDRLNDRGVELRTEQLAALYYRMFGEEEQQPRVVEMQTQVDELASGGSDELTDEDIDLLDRAMQAKNGEKFAALFRGEWGKYYKSQSEADLGFLSMLRFWCRGNQAQIDRIYRHSRLCRDKYLDRNDYRYRTISKALQGETMQPKIEVIQGGAGEWRKKLLLNSNDAPRAVLANVLIALREAPEWKGILAFDEFALRPMLRGRAPWMDTAPSEPVEWTSEHDTACTEWMQRNGLFVGVDVVATAVEKVAREHGYHPIRDYLNGLKWDGKPRIDTWLTDHFGVKDTPYSRAIGAKWLISAVARVFKPGCKADHVLVLEGDQGVGKSSALAALATPWFVDQVDNFEDKDAILQIHKGWIIELAELDALNRSELSRIKNFLSRSSDNYRPPYGKRCVDEPRQCVFAGTVNHSGYLKDETGNRRFWPVRCETPRVDVGRLAAERDQLWSEAVVRFRQGEMWHLDEATLVAQAVDEQAQRVDEDPWSNAVLSYCEGLSEVSVGEILEHALEKPIPTWSQSDKNRVARVLIADGWQRVRVREKGKLVWRYRRGER
jgi:predicted P-loop ATPase